MVELVLIQPLAFLTIFFWPNSIYEKHYPYLSVRRLKVRVGITSPKYPPTRGFSLIGSVFSQRRWYNKTWVVNGLEFGVEHRKVMVNHHIVKDQGCPEIPLPVLF